MLKFIFKCYNLRQDKDKFMEYATALSNYYMHVMIKIDEITKIVLENEKLAENETSKNDKLKRALTTKRETASELQNKLKKIMDQFCKF